jgi:hypothetical protein
VIILLSKKPKCVMTSFQFLYPIMRIYAIIRVSLCKSKCMKLVTFACYPKVLTLIKYHDVFKALIINWPKMIIHLYLIIG